MIGFLKGLPMSLKITAPIILVLVVMLAAAKVSEARAWRKAVGEGFRADSIGVVLDTTRLLSDMRLKAVVGELSVYERRSLQVEEVSSALAKALNTQAQAVATMTGQIVSLATRVTSTTPTTENAEGVRSASFVVDQTPYKGTAQVDLPRPPGAGKLDLKIDLDPAPISLLLSCSAPMGNVGIREARANVTSPPWLKVSLSKVEQDRDVCNPDAVTTAKAAQKRLGLGVTLGYCATRAADAKVYAGPCLGVGGTWRIWP